ncbi:hypothetical protein P7H33_02255 [Vagococcus lutrae]|uniref:hypothetical protein n=1 Tax=Vagococcus lutrae TaxID=81947 RepID=UPI00288F5DF5|nr:hypothetical protein [Vagococcus lutrae]MDT2811765.1 hypothetical protein [Vagococcus lutrae]
MQVLKIESGKSYFIIGEENVSPEELSRDHLFSLLSSIYEDDEHKIIFPDNTELDTLRNPVEKEIVNQILQKISDFTNNVSNIRQEVQVQFPMIEE